MPLSDSQNTRKSPRRMDIRCRCNDDDMYLTSYANSSAFHSSILGAYFVTSKGRKCYEKLVENSYWRWLFPSEFAMLLLQIPRRRGHMIAKCGQFFGTREKNCMLTRTHSSKMRSSITYTIATQYISYNCMMRYDLEWIDMDLTFSITV